MIMFEIDKKSAMWYISFSQGKIRDLNYIGIKCDY